MPLSLLSSQLRRLIAASHGGSVNAAARDIRIPQATLARMVDGRVTNPKADSLRPVAAYYGTSIDWLLTGEGAGPNPARAEMAEGDIDRRWDALLDSLELDADDRAWMAKLPTAIRNAATSMPLKYSPEEMAAVGLEHVLREQAALRRAQQLETEAWLTTLSAWVAAWGVSAVREALSLPEMRTLVRGGFRSARVVHRPRTVRPQIPRTGRKRPKR